MDDKGLEKSITSARELSARYKPAVGQCPCGSFGEWSITREGYICINCVLMAHKKKDQIDDGHGDTDL